MRLLLLLSCMDDPMPAIGFHPMSTTHANDRPFSHLFIPPFYYSSKKQ